MQDKLTQIKAMLGYSGSEVFPKQTELKSQDDTGNFLNLPYFKGNDTTRYAFNNNGEAVNLDGFYNLYNLKKITPQQLEELKIKRPETPYSDGPPCIELMAQNKLVKVDVTMHYSTMVYMQKTNGQIIGNQK